MTTTVDLSGIIQSVSMLKDIVDAHRSMRNFNELAAAVSKVNAELLAAQAAAVASYKEQLANVQHVHELEKRIVELENWDRERERYQLAEIAPGVTAYALKPGMEHGEPLHLLCANCFTKGEKSILQAAAPVGLPITVYQCLRCGSTLQVASRPLQVRTSRG